MNKPFVKLSRTIILALMLTNLTHEVNYVQAQVIKSSDEKLDRIDIEEHLSQFIPLDLKFTNDRNVDLTLGEYFNKGKPVILVMAYYECPMLCNLVLNGLSASVYKLGWQPSDKYQIVTVSFDPTENYELAAAKKKNYMASIDNNSNNGWDFLVGEESQSKALSEALGFKYYYDDSQEQFAHAAVIFILTEEGKISRYLYGIDFPSNDLKFGLLEASEGKVGSTIDRLLLYCYRYDPDVNGYVVFAGNVMRLGGFVSLMALLIFMGLLWGKERYRKNKTQTIKIETGNFR